MQPIADTTFAQAEGFLEQNYLKANPPRLQRLIVAIYRLLAAGEPIEIGALAAATGLEETGVRNLLGLVPDSAYDLADDGRIAAFIGLSTVPTRHRLIVGGTQIRKNNQSRPSVASILIASIAPTVSVAASSSI